MTTYDNGRPLQTLALRGHRCFPLFLLRVARTHKRSGAVMLACSSGWVVPGSTKISGPGCPASSFPPTVTSAPSSHPREEVLRIPHQGPPKSSDGHLVSARLSPLPQDETWASHHLPGLNHLINHPRPPTTFSPLFFQPHFLQQPLTDLHPPRAPYFSPIIEITSAYRSSEAQEHHSKPILPARP